MRRRSRVGVLVIALLACGCGGRAIHESTAADNPTDTLDSGDATAPLDAGLGLVIAAPIDPINANPNGPSLPPELQPGCDPTPARQVLASDIQSASGYGLLGSMPQNGGASDSLVLARYGPDRAVSDVMRITKDGCSTQVLSRRDGFRLEVAVSSTNAYWTESLDSYLWTVPIHGGTPERINIAPYGHAEALAADASALYVYATSDEGARLIRVAGRDVEVFTDVPAFSEIPVGGGITLRLDGPNIWIEYVDYTLDTAGPGALVYVDGSTRLPSLVKLAPGLSTGNMVAYGGFAYLASGGFVYRLDRSHDPVRLVNATSMGMAVDATGLYWAGADSQLWAARLDGTGLRQVGTDGTAIALDDANMYWTTTHNQLVRVRK
jgi:hypothetical protein